MGDDGSWKVVGVAIAAFFLVAGIALALFEDLVPSDTLALASEPTAVACAPGMESSEAPAGAGPPCPAPP